MNRVHCHSRRARRRGGTEPSTHCVWIASPIGPTVVAHLRVGVAEQSSKRSSVDDGEGPVDSLLLHILSCTTEDELYRTLTQLLFELQRPAAHHGDDDDMASVVSCA